MLRPQHLGPPLEGLLQQRLRFVVPEVIQCLQCGATVSAAIAKVSAPSACLLPLLVGSPAQPFGTIAPSCAVHTFTHLPCACSSDPRSLRVVRVAGCSEPSTFRLPSRARWYMIAASSYTPWCLSRPARLFTAAADTGAGQCCKSG